MTQVAVVSYPRLADVDQRWIESIRAAHDPQAPLLAAHFTFVFPADVQPDDVAAEVTAAAAAAGPIRFVIRSARAERDVFRPGGHVFLVPAEGAGEITTLHHRLYGGVLEPHRRADIPFIPHITVAAGPDFAWCEAVAAGLNRDPRVVSGTIDNLELIEIADGIVSSKGRFNLGSRARDL